MTTLWFDTETFSECDLKSRGTHRYASAPSTEITVAQWAIDDGEPVVEDLFGARRPSRQLLAHLNNHDIQIEAHNSHFDRTLVRYVWGLDIPVARWRDTMVRALAHGLPGALGKIGAVLGLPDDQQKDKRGQQLIQLFCKPLAKNIKLRRATPQTHPAEWAEFLEYSRQDVVSMRAICARLPKWNYGVGAEVRERELTLWHLDQKINDRGVMMDVTLARAAVEACEIEKVRLKGEMRELTNDLVDGPSKRADILYFILAEYGVDLPDLKADTLRRRMEDPELPDGVKLLLAIRLEGTKTSTAKYKALLNAVSEDERLRNTLQFAGASRTERWAGRIFQPQNLLRPDLQLMANYHGVTLKELDDSAVLQADYRESGITALKEGCAELFFDNVTGLAANVVRSCIIAPPDKKLVIADLANIEGRGLAYLAGEEWKLDAFRAYDAGTGPDLYILAYARAFSIDPKDVEKWMRQIGKVMELGLGYQGGVAAFLTFAAVYKMDLEVMADAVHRTASKQALAAAYKMWEWAEKKHRTLGLSKSVYVACEVLKSLWRAAHPMTVQLWDDAQLAMQKAIMNPGVAFEIGQYMKAQRDGSWLRIRLPSGRCLCYLNPKIDASNQLTYMGVNQYTKQWGRIKTYGGKLCIAEGTKVLTLDGWKPIEYITAVDKVWDGVEWVSQDGAVCNGVKEVIEAYGARMTPDHKVLTESGWQDASQSKRYNRAACRLPDGVGLPGQCAETPVNVVRALRLRHGKNDGSVRVAEAAQTRDNGVVRLQAKRDDTGEEHYPRHESASSLLGVAQHGGSMPLAFTSVVAQLRRARHYGVRALARIVREFLGGYGPNVLRGAGIGSGEERSKLHQEKLPLGDVCGEREQQTKQHSNSGHDDSRIQQDLWSGKINSGVPTRSRVYDLVNCGPRSRFVVATEGWPLIVHNCENATQAWARDVLAWHMPEIDNSGYEIVLTVHDELITETPDTPEYSHENLAYMMTDAIPWAPGAPLAAAGFETKRYYKG